MDNKGLLKNIPMKHENNKNNKKLHFLRHTLSAFFGSILAWLIIHLLFFSCRKYIFGYNNFKKHIRENANKVLSASWHRSMLYTLFFFRNLDAALMASRSRDGEFITAVLRRFGYFTPRGSSGKGKGGQQALERFIEHIRKGKIGGLSVDGPTGPPYVSKHGIITAASKTGASIFPHIWYAQSNIRINSWDRTIVPKPFSKLVMIIDREPLSIPVNIDQEQLEEYRQVLNKRLLQLTYQADCWFELRDKYPDPRDMPVPDPVPFPYHPPKKKKTLLNVLH